MRKKRQNHSAEIKVKVAIEALKFKTLTASGYYPAIAPLTHFSEHSRIIM